MLGSLPNELENKLGGKCEDLFTAAHLQGIYWVLEATK